MRYIVVYREDFEQIMRKKEREEEEMRKDKNKLVKNNSKYMSQIKELKDKIQYSLRQYE